MTHHWFYISAPYFLPILGYLFGIALVLVFVVIQYVGASCMKENFKEIHIKFAIVLLGRNVSVRKKDGAIILHDFAFRRGLGYIFISECILAGTILLFTMANLVYVSTEPCNAVNKNTVDCYWTTNISANLEKQDCSLHLQTGTASELICYNISFDFGIGLAMLGGLLYLLPLMHSSITGFIVNNSGQERQLRYFTVILQVAVIALIGICLTGCLVGLELDSDHLSPKVFVEVVFFLLYLLTTFSMPWCCMARDESKIYVFDDGGNITESYENLTASDSRSREREPLYPNGNTSAAARGRYPRRK